MRNLCLRIKLEWLGLLRLFWSVRRILKVGKSSKSNLHPTCHCWKNLRIFHRWQIYWFPGHGIHLRHMNLCIYRHSTTCIYRHSTTCRCLRHVSCNQKCLLRTHRRRDTIWCLVHAVCCWQRSKTWRSSLTLIGRFFAHCFWLPRHLMPRWE